MSRTRNFALALGAVAILAFAWRHYHWPGEGPIIRGQRISIWFAQYCAALRTGDTGISGDCIASIRLLGTNAVTFLVDATCSTDTNGILFRLRKQADQELPQELFPASLDALKKRLADGKSQPPFTIEEVRTKARQGLVEMRAAPEAILPPLRGKLVDYDPTVRRQAILVLRDMDDFSAVEPLLVQAVSETDEENQLLVIQTFAHFKSPSKPFGRALLLAFKNARSDRQFRMASTLAHYKSPEALPLLLRLFPTDNQTNQLYLATAIWNLQPDHPEVRTYFERELRTLGPNYSTALDHLTALPSPPLLPPEFFTTAQFNSILQSGWGFFQVPLFVEVGYPRPDAIKLLENILPHRQGNEQSVVAKVLWQLDPGSPPALNAVLNIIRTPADKLPPAHADAPVFATVVLASWGSSAAAAIPLLKGLLITEPPAAKDQITAAINRLEQRISADRAKTGNTNQPTR